MMVMATMMMMVRFSEGGSRQECNHGKQQDLFHIFDDKRLKTSKVQGWYSITLRIGDALRAFPILAFRGVDMSPRLPDS
jgi:hypothetical protein